jgi:hypothetical protein
MTDPSIADTLRAVHEGRGAEREAAASSNDG